MCPWNPFCSASFAGQAPCTGSSYGVMNPADAFWSGGQLPKCKWELMDTKVSTAPADLCGTFTSLPMVHTLV